ncbi:DUF937 domain-containing protein [Hyphomicrobium sp. 1Nfss2.1]|uniref:DUF937 domain-containing protein n=1 Tax=Hyphomicrobium sp. 1Nfss2.1 TaxID=3413936 RepID=UPI003C7DBA10
MSTNLVASVAKLLTPELLSRVAQALGIDQSMIEKAVSAGVPGLLAAFMSLVNKPGGATRLADAASQVQPGALADFANSGPASQRDAMDMGLGAISSLLGGNTVSTLAQSLGRYSGIGEGASKGLIGLLGPMVLGVLGQQQRTSGLSASGLANMLQSQAGNISRALPSGFARQLSDAGILEQPTSVTGMSRTRADDRSQWGWVAPALAVVALGALAWYLFGRPHETTTVANAPSAVETPMQAPGARDLTVTAADESRWIGRPIFSRNNEKVGEIAQIKRGADDKITDIYFDGGTFLGVGDRRYHITANEIQETRPDGVVLTLDEAQVKQLPEAQGAMKPQ